jgi:uncharacterized membrane protein
MNGAHLHLIFNHLPIVFPIVALLVLIGGFLFKSAVIKRVALSIFVAGSIAALPAILTGDGAEEVVENYAGISESLIHEHEEIAETFAILSYALGVFALIGLWANWKKKSFSNYLAVTVLIFSLVVLFFAQQAGTSGGEIRHEEIRANAATVMPEGDDD